MTSEEVPKPSNYFEKWLEARFDKVEEHLKRQDARLRIIEEKQDKANGQNGQNGQNGRNSHRRLANLTNDRVLILLCLAVVAKLTGLNLAGII